MGCQYAERKHRADPLIQKKDSPATPSLDALKAGTAQPTQEQLGRPVDLPGAIRAKMEASFGADLSAVKLYESQTAADAGVNAVAQGNRIVFAPGALDFTSASGQTLLGHELSHVVSQARGQVAGSGFLNDHTLESRADREGAMAAAGLPVYTGPVTSALSSASAVTAAGPMQAEKGKSDKKRNKQLAKGIQAQDAAGQVQSLGKLAYGASLGQDVLKPGEGDVMTSLMKNGITRGNGFMQAYVQQEIEAAQALLASHRQFAAHPEAEASQNAAFLAKHSPSGNAFGELQSLASSANLHDAVRDPADSFQSRYSAYIQTNVDANTQRMLQEAHALYAMQEAASSPTLGADTRESVRRSNRSAAKQAIQNWQRPDPARTAPTPRSPSRPLPASLTGEYQTLQQSQDRQARAQAYNTISGHMAAHTTPNQQQVSTGYVHDSRPINELLYQSPRATKDPQEIQALQTKIEQLSAAIESNPLADDLTTYRGISDTYLSLMLRDVGLKQAVRKDGTVNHQWMNRNPKKVQKALVGSVFTDPGFTSTSIDRTVSENWARKVARTEAMDRIRKAYEDNPMAPEAAEASEKVVTQAQQGALPGVHLLQVSMPKGASASLIDQSAMAGRVDSCQKEVLANHGSSYRITGVQRGSGPDSYFITMEMLAEAQRRKGH